MAKEVVKELRSVTIDLLDPDPRNAKEHTDTQIDQICASIQDYGFADPVGVLAKPDGRYMIVEGHGRVLALKKMGAQDVECLILPPMTENERKAYAIAHNQIQSITGLDMHVVAEEFERLDVGNDDYLSLGFTQEDVLFLLPDPSDNASGEMGENGEGGGDGGYGNQSWKGFIPPVYKSNMRFNTEGDQLAFYQFVNVLRGRYLTAATIAERFVLFVEEFGPKEEGDANADV